MQEIVLKPVLKTSIAFFIILIIASIGGFTTRDSFLPFIIQYTIVFSAYFLVMRSNYSIKNIAIIGILARVSLIFFSPELSDDFYRFVWDGELLTHGINPYDFKPNELISYGQFLSNDYYLSLYHGMSELSQSNYSCYPVLNQLIFGLSTLFSDNLMVNTVIMKSIVILADIGALLIGIRILNVLNLPIKKIGWYFLNPLIILEFSGNLHFEGVALFFILLFVYFALKNNWMLAGLFLGCAVHIKLIPLMLIPFVYKKFGWKKSLGFTACTLLITLLLGQLLIGNHNFKNILESLELYFNLFQSNASLFSWVNALYSNYIGWDTTSIVGPLLGKITVILIILLGILKAYRQPIDLLTTLMFVYTIYYVLSTTVNPWYISSILLFSVFTGYRYAILWTFLVMGSYLAYDNPDYFIENKMVNTILYVVLYSYLVYEIYKFWRKDSIGLQIKGFFFQTGDD